MLKKLLPFVVMALVTACSNTQPASQMTMSCCEKCESSSCKDCCAGGDCACCKDGACKMCEGKKDASATAGDKPCKICDEAERAWKAKQGKVKH